MKKITVMVNIQIPSTPNFIMDGNGNAYPISSFKENELRSIGKQWTDLLIEKSKKTQINSK